MYKPLTNETKAKIICFRATKRDLEKLKYIGDYLGTDDDGTKYNLNISEIMRSIIDGAYESIKELQRNTVQ